MDRISLTPRSRDFSYKVNKDQEFSLALGFDFEDLYGHIYVHTNDKPNILFGLSFGVMPKFKNWKLILPKYYNSVLWTWYMKRHKIVIQPVWYIKGVKYKGTSYMLPTINHQFVLAIIKSQNKGFVFSCKDKNGKFLDHEVLPNNPNLEGTGWYLNPFMNYHANFDVQLGVFTPKI